MALDTKQLLLTGGRSVAQGYIAWLGYRYMRDSSETQQALPTADKSLDGEVEDIITEDYPNRGGSC